MSFSVSADELESTITLHPGGRQFSLSPDGPCRCMSTDSSSSHSLNKTGACRSPDTIKDCCFNRGSSEIHSQSDAFDQLHVACSMNQAFVFTPVNESQVQPSRTFCRGPKEMDSCSLSSGEMVMRSKSFCLQDQSLIVFSSMDGSSASPAQSGASFPADSPPLSTSLPEVYTNSQEGVSKESSGHPCLGVTFIQGDDGVPQSEENIGSCLVTLPSEEAGDLFMTFICDTPTDGPKEVDSSCAEAELLPNFSLGTTPELCKTFVSSALVSQDSDAIYTSTPNQNIGNKILSHPSLSPCTEKTSSPEIQPVKRPQVSVTPRQRPAAGVTASLSKVKTMEVKSKVLKKGAAGLNSQQKPLPHSFLMEVNRRAAVGLSHAKVKNTAREMSATSKTQNEASSQVHKGFGHLGAAVRQFCKQKAVDVQNKTRPCVPNPASGHNSDGSTPSASAPNPSALLGSPTSVTSSKKRTPPSRDVPNKTPVRSGSTEGRDKAPGKNTWPRSLSESSSSRSHRNRVATLRVTTSFTLPDSEVTQLLLNDTNLSCSSQHKETEDKSSSREVKKISLVKGQSKSTSAGAPLDPNKASSHSASSSGRGRGASFSQPAPPSPSQRPNPLSARLKPVIQGRMEGKGSRSVPLIQQKDDNSGSQKAQAAEGSFPVKSKLNGSLTPQTPNRPSVMGPPSVPVYRSTRKTPASLKGCADRGAQNELGQRTRSTTVAGRAVSEQSPFKSVVLKDRLPSAHGKSSGPILSGVFKPPASTSKTSDSRISPLKKNSLSRFVRPTSSECVDKNKTKVGPRRQPPPSPPNTSAGPQNAPQAGVPQSKKNGENIFPPKQLLTASNQRFQALAVVLQKTLTERDEATRQCRELRQEQLHLQQELVSSVAACDRLEKEKEELRAGLEDALHKLQNQHQKELLELEQKLQAFYQAERENVHLRYQEEADKHQTLMQQQIEELRANHEAMKLELESAHVQQLQCVQQQHVKALEELRKTHSQELQTLDKSFKDAEVALFKQVQELMEEKALLMKKLEVEQQRRRELAETSQKDSHILYLEQELESLNVVLDMKTEQLHQQEKKLMEFEKLTERNVKLDECLKKAQQENEDLKARMERHAALSRQLSTEQAVLQESLFKESKVNKRLSMENEELLWKLHNGDLSSPRKTSPSSPPGSFFLQSPRSSDLYSSPPLSPR